jgi:hypothetical protein
MIDMLKKNPSKYGHIVGYDLQNKFLILSLNKSHRKVLHFHKSLYVSDSLKLETKSVNIIPNSGSSFTPSWPTLTINLSCRLRPP